MPLLRGKPFLVKSPSQNLKDDDEVFCFDLTNEIFTDYDEFFERVILCNSLLWTCECTGRNGLTYKEAMDSEQSVRKALRAIPDATKRAVLLLVHQTKRSRIADLCEEIMDYLKKRYQEEEVVEVKIKEKWKKARVDKTYVKCPSSPKGSTPKKATNDANIDKGTPKTARKTDNDVFSTVSSNSNSQAVPFHDYLYDVTVLRSENPSKLQRIEANQIRRQKGSLNKDLLRLLLRQTCKRTTVASENGYWVVEPEVVIQYSLGESNIGSGPLSFETPAKLKNKRKRSAGKQDSVNESPSKKRKSTDADDVHSYDNTKQKTPGKRGRKSSEKGGKQNKKVDEKKLTPAQKKKLLEKNRLKELAEKEKLKKKKLLAKEKERERLKKEKEEERQKRKVEKEREKERTNEIRKLEIEFMKGWSNVKDDLNLEDLMELPEPTRLPTTFQGNIFGDIVMVVEFLNTFGTFYDIKDSIPQNITYGK